MSIDAEVWAVANEVCSPAELRALRKREDLVRADAFTWAALAERLGCSVSGARYQVERAEAKIAAARNGHDGRCEQVGPFGRCELEDGHEGWCAVLFNGPGGVA